MIIPLNVEYILLISDMYIATENSTVLPLKSEKVKTRLQRYSFF